MSILSKVKSAVWGQTPTDPREARLLVKIDWFVLSFVCLLYWVNYVDRLNISNAYVSGMQEDLNMVGNEFNQINTMFNVGYIVFLIPNNLILLKIRPRYWLTFCAVAWALLTLGIYKVTSYKQIMVIRFFQAGFESSTFTGAHLILGSWYKEDELTRRSAIFTSAGLIGNIFSSTMQAAIYTNMDNLHGLAGWRWLFIIDFAITIPIAIYGFILFPDTPETCKAFYFTEEDVELAKSRLPPRTHTKLDWTVIKRVIGNWHWWFFSILWILGGENESFATNSLFSLWLKFYGYSVDQRNHYPMGVYAVGILATFTCALYVDNTGAKYHWRVGLVITFFIIIAAILQASGPTHKSVVFAAQYLGGFAYAGQATFFAWANVVCRNDLQERAVVLASMNMFSNAWNAWWSLLFFPATTAPEFKKGCWAILATSISSGIFCGVIRWFQLREDRENPLIDDVEATSETSAVSMRDEVVELKQ